MAKVWVYNKAIEDWEQVTPPPHPHPEYLTVEEAENSYLTVEHAEDTFAPIEHTELHEGVFLKPDQILPGTGIVITPNDLTGEVTIGLSATTADEVGIGPSAPTSGPTGPYELFVDASGTGSFGLYSTGPTSPGIGGGVTDHGQLTGIEDDDHKQYLTQSRGEQYFVKLDGTSKISVPPTDKWHLANKEYVDTTINQKVYVSDFAATGTMPAGSVWIEY